ncbi:uncharacterized protein EV154DRAFT_513170 [Mucor mucedo]|uniref:uncharacterized protein n=1 Tax=Mucor mucedo TaxID=29922 RepID=UPI002220AC98|nr:uncharacterized protein EV154DRAFT_513170 [Mucor mucedo]KAI7889880.1 hypothetical protein EV154DRAFT_513170 [Mucor mucedo]
MRPDNHKAKESRRYQARKKKEGDTEAADVAEARKKAAKARDRGLGLAAVMRRNAEPSEETEEEKEARKAHQAKFSRRKLDSNADRYKEVTEQEIVDRDAELGIDRETTDLVSMLENTEEGSSTFFKFKEEQLFNQDQQDAVRNMMHLDFTIFEPALERLDTEQLLGLDEGELIENILHEQPIVLDKPIVPSFSKNAKGYVLFKSQQPVKPNVISEENGIYVRNDRAIPTNNHRKEVPSSPPVKDDLDELLALRPTPPASASAAPKLKKITALPRPGSIKKEEPVMDDEAWLDDLLG